jgi:hypothetical protein
VPLTAVIDLLHALFAHENALPELAQLYTVLQAESLDAAHPAHESFRAREASVLDLFTRLIGPYVVDPRSTARQMLALREGLRLQWLRADRSFDPLAEWIRAVTVLVPKLAPLREKHGLGPEEKVQPGPARRGLERRPKNRPIKTIHR